MIGRLSSIVYRLSSLVMPYCTLLHYTLLLRAGHYDLAIVGRDDHWWGAALVLLAGVPCRIGFAVPECRPFLTTALPWNPRDHVTTQGLALVGAAVGPHPPAPSPAAAGEGERVVGLGKHIDHSALNSQFSIFDFQFSILNS